MRPTASDVTRTRSMVKTLSAVVIQHRRQYNTECKMSTLNSQQLLIVHRRTEL